MYWQYAAQRSGTQWSSTSNVYILTSTLPESYSPSGDKCKASDDLITVEMVKSARIAWEKCGDRRSSSCKYLLYLSGKIDETASNNLSCHFSTSPIHGLHSHTGPFQSFSTTKNYTTPPRGEQKLASLGVENAGLDRQWRTVEGVHQLAPLPKHNLKRKALMR